MSSLKIIDCQHEGEVVTFVTGQDVFDLLTDDKARIDEGVQLRLSGKVREGSVDPVPVNFGGRSMSIDWAVVQVGDKTFKMPWAQYVEARNESESLSDWAMISKKLNC